MFYTPNIVCYQGFLSWGSWVKFDMWFSLEIVMDNICLCDCDCVCVFDLTENYKQT